MLITQKNIKKVVKGVIAAMPAIPYIMRRSQRSSMTAYVLSGVGLAVAGGLVAFMFFSPRTRTRALSAAKDTYGKVNEKITHLREAKLGGYAQETPMANGLGNQDKDNYGTVTGL